MHHLPLATLADPPTVDRRDIVLAAFLEALGDMSDGGRPGWLHALLADLREMEPETVAPEDPSAFTEALLQCHGLASRLDQAVNAARNLGLLPKPVAADVPVICDGQIPW